MTARRGVGARIRRSRLKFERDFTQVPNEWLRDKNLSRRARGLLGELMSHDVDFEVSVRGLLAAGPEGRDAIDAAIRELKELGYLDIVQLRGRKGTFEGSLWELTDPVEVRRRRAQQPPLFAVGGENRSRTNRKPVQPHAENPAHGTPPIEDQPQEELPAVNESRSSTRARVDMDPAWCPNSSDHLHERPAPEARCTLCGLLPQQAFNGGDVKWIGESA